MAKKQERRQETVADVLYRGRLRAKIRDEVRAMLDGRSSRDEPWQELEALIDELAEFERTGEVAKKVQARAINEFRAGRVANDG